MFTRWNIPLKMKRTVGNLCSTVPPLQATRQPHSTGRSKLNTGPCGSPLALQPLGAHPWCWFSRGVSRRQSKRYGMQGEEGKCGQARIRNLRRWERTQSALNECGRGESRRVEGGEREDAAEWRVCHESGCIGLTDRREQEGTQWRGCISRMSQADYSAATSFFSLDSAFPSRLCPLLSLSLFSHFLDRCSKYPSAVNSNRSFNDTSRHWQVLSSCATIGKDLRKDKIGPTNSDNKEHIMARWCFHTVLHCHLVLGILTGAPIRDADCYLQSVTVKPCTGTCRSGKGLCTRAFPTCSVHKAKM